MRVLDAWITKSNGRHCRYGIAWEDGCHVHYSTTGEYADAAVTWVSRACDIHRKRKSRG